MADPADIEDMGDCPMEGSVCEVLERINQTRETEYAAIMRALQAHNARLDALEKAEAQAGARAKEMYQTLQRISVDVSRMSGQLSLIVDAMRMLRYVGQVGRED